MTLETIIERVRAESKRQESLGFDYDHDEKHTSGEWAALLAKQAGDAGMAARWSTTGSGHELPLFEEVVIQLITVAVKSLGARI